MSKQYKVYRETNYIRVIDTTTNELFNGTVKDVFVDKSNTQKNIYRLFNVKDLAEDTVFSIPDILKANGSAYSVSEWEAFYTENTGNFNGGGTAPTNLSYTPSPTQGTVTSDTGTDATIPLADGTNAGLLKPTKFTVLENTSGVNTGDQDLSGKANINSPSFTGTPTAPTATVGTNTTQIATTAFVNNTSNLKEDLFNKQNSLAVDGTNTKYPTVDAINSGTAYKRTIAQIRALSGVLPNTNFYTTDLEQEGNWYYDAIDIISADNTGTILVTADGKRIKRVTQGAVNVMWFGAKADYSGDSGTDNVPAFNNAIASISSVNYLEIPKGAYFLSAPITIAKSIKIKSLGDFYFASGSDGFIFDGGNGNEKFDIALEGVIKGTNTGSAYDSYVNTGVVIKNTYSCVFKFDNIQGFKEGLKLNSVGDGASPAGCQYNNISWNYFTNNKDNIILECTGTAINWINENRFFGGRLTGKNGVVFKKGIGQIDPFNGNKFYNVGIEGLSNGNGFHLNFADNNSFYSPRTSGAENVMSTMVRIESNSRGNQFYGIYLYESDIIDNGFENLYQGNILTPLGNTIGAMAISRGGKLTSLGFFKNATAFGESSNNLMAIGKTTYSPVIFAETLFDGVSNRVEYTPSYVLVDTSTCVLPRLIGYARISSSAGNDIILKINPSDYSSGSVTLKKIVIDNATSGAVFITLKNSVNDAVLITRTLIPQGKSEMIWSSSDWRLIFGSGLTIKTPVTAVAGVGKNTGMIVQSIASANGDELIAYDLDSTFNLGVFTGVKSWGLRMRGLYSRGFRNLFKPDIQNTSPNVAIIATNSYSNQTYTLTTLGIPAGGKDYNKVSKLLTRMVTNVPSVDGLFYLSVGSHTSNSDISDPLIAPETVTDVIEIAKTGAKLLGIPTAPTAVLGTNTTQIATTAFVQANSRPYKVYTALLTQSGTSAPVATVLENNLGGTVVWSREAAGFYNATLAGVFTLNKTTVLITQGDIQAIHSGYGDSLTNHVNLLSRSFAGMQIDNLLDRTTIEIRVYN